MVKLYISAFASHFAGLNGEWGGIVKALFPSWLVESIKIGIARVEAT